MKSNELRTGNLVLLKCKNEKDEIAKLLSIDEIDGCYYNNASNKKHINKKYTQRRNGWCKFDVIYPIPLTEEWLLKFRFSYNGYPESLSLSILSRGILNAYNISEKPRIEISTLSGIIFGETKIESVHQLQNLYFALTGEELISNK